MIKSFVGGCSKAEEYPRLMKSPISDAVFLVTKVNKGTNSFEGVVVHGTTSSGHGVGAYSVYWGAADRLEPQTKPITLSNVE